MLFEARTDERGGWSVVRVIGEVDLGTLPSVKQELDRAGLGRVAVDLTSVDYVDPVALGVLVAGALRATRAGGRFAVVCPPGRSRDLLGETGLDRILTVVDGTADLPDG